MEGKKLEAKAIGANEALDYLWIVMVSSTAYPLKSTIIQYLNIQIATHDLKTRPLFGTHFQEQLATASVSAGALFPSPTGMQPSRQ